ncbi:unnamed protein product [Durusdinium trenchii]|uniref:Uncharacterized protein n=1 Tax=Durusdinium trenchii TaxID=1381693 RepID=A0ABP0KC58_9DINO
MASDRVQVCCRPACALACGLACALVLVPSLSTKQGVQCFTDGLDFGCTKPTPSSEVWTLIGVLLALRCSLALLAYLLTLCRRLLQRASHSGRARASSAHTSAEDGLLANPLDPAGADYWEGRSVGRGISVFLPDARKQKELLRTWNQRESFALLGTGSYLIRQPDLLLWWDLPEEMVGLLSEDQSVVYAALGPEKQYFLRSAFAFGFVNGDTCWSLWSELSQQIKEQEQREHRVSYVCIAPDRGYFVLFESGGWAHNRLPESLRCFLTQNRERLSQVDTMSVSHEGAWFVSFRDGLKPRWRCDRLPRRLGERLLQLSGGDWKIQSVEFGFDGSWLLRFDSFEGAQKERETRLALWAV